MKEKEINSLFDEWNRALQTGDPKKVVALYADQAILLPTVSNQVRHNHQEIEEYFTHFLAKEPIGKINESNVRIYEQLAINSGIYTFTFKDSSIVQARFTFVYRLRDDSRLIVEHHSSQMPEQQENYASTNSKMLREVHLRTKNNLKAYLKE